MTSPAPQPGTSGTAEARAPSPHRPPSPDAVMPTYARQDLVFESGEGCWLTTTSGDRFLDLGSGVAVNALGHAHPRLVAALTAQAHKLWHTSNLYRVAGQERVGALLTGLTFADKVFFCNSGAEACEGAIKIARRYHFVGGAPQRQRIITFAGAFHGRTLTALAAAGNPKYLEGFGEPAPGFDNLPLGDLDAVERCIGPQTAAIMVEPVQGEGGVRVVSDEMLRHLRALCDAHGLLLVLDEVQTGVGRTGKLFAHEWAGIRPDVMAVAKGIGSGFPVGAILATDEAARGMTAGTHGSTFGGNPLAMSVAEAVLEVVTEPGFLQAVEQKALRFRQALAAVKDEAPGVIEEVRGRGLLIGLKLAPAFQPPEFVKAGIAEHVLTVGAGDNVVRVLPPLTIADDEISEAATRLSRAARSLANSKR